MAKLAGYGAIDGFPEKIDTENSEIMKMFPIMFTLICCLLFMVPSYLIVYMVYNPVVSYWMDSTTWTVLLIPFIIFVAHVVQSRQGKPVKYAILAALVVPSLILLFLGNATLATSGIGSLLFSVDCNAIPEKAKLQTSWDAAFNVYQSCIEKTAAQQNLTEEYLAKNFRIQDCTEYPNALKKNERRWNYLRMLEEKEYCTGFCKPGPNLWSKTGSKDSCSVAVSAIMTNLVSAHSQQVQLIMFIVLVACFIAVVTMGPTLRENGVDW